MNTNLKLWISTAMALAVCVCTFLWQRSSIGAVRTEIGELEEQLDNSKSYSLKSGASADIQPLAKKIERRPAAELIAMLPEGDSDPVASFRAIRVMFEELRDYSSDELLELAEQMGRLAKDDPAKAGIIGMPRSLLMQIIAEDAPEKVLALLEKDGEDAAELRSMAIASLARKDPDRALRYLEDAKLNTRENRIVRTAIVTELIRSDLPRALEMLRSAQSNLLSSGMGLIVTASNDPTVREKLWSAARVENDPVLRHELAKGLMTADYLRGGISKVRDAFEEADFLDSKTAATIVRDVTSTSMQSEPDETFAWICEVLPAESSPQVVANALQSWAQNDFNAAGKWLGEQESSPQRDAAMATFATTVVGIDPEAAIAWAVAINDEPSRQKALDLTLDKWSMQDPDATSAWAEANGIDPQQIPGILRAVEK